MTIYLAGPMSGYPENNYPAFRSAAAYLRDLGYDVRSAHRVAHRTPEGRYEYGQVEGYAHEDYLRDDIRVALLPSQAIALLPGWHKSKGAVIEFTLAMGLNMKAMFLYPADNTWTVYGGEDVIKRHAGVAEESGSQGGGERPDLPGSSEALLQPRCNCACHDDFPYDRFLCCFSDP